MRLVTTPTGNTGRHVLATVASVDPSVRAFVRDPAKLSGRAPGAIVTGDLHDRAVLDKALVGIDAAFFCVPQSENPENVVPTSTASRARLRMRLVRRA